MGLKNIGVLWKHEKEGKRYMSGNLELINGQKVTVMVMPYEPKTENQKNAKNPPAFTILLVTEDEKKKEETKSDW